MTRGAAEPKDKAGLGRYLSAFAAWGLSFGYAVGWGAFVMPGASFLPGAGPLGTAIGILAAGGIAVASKRLAVRVNLALAAMLVVGVSGCFALAVMRHGGGLASLAPAFSPLPHPPAPSRILVADDTKMNQLVLKTMFTKLGVKDMTFANNGREALDILKDPAARPFDFVLTDLFMPEMTGEELVAAIRADSALAPLKVYLFTADAEMKETYAAKGFDGILLKPVNLESLRSLFP